MATMEELMPIWDEIDRAESCLVCCLCDEAASLASAILRRLIENYNPSRTDGEISEDYRNEWSDMVESAGMVLVQSVKQLERTPEVLKELKLLFGSLTSIPIQVFLAGVCFQMFESPSHAVRGSLEEFLNNWRYVDGRYCPLGAEDSITVGPCCSFSIGVDEYLEVVELYVIKLLSMTMKDGDHAISWVENAMLPMEKRQELLRRLQSMNSSKFTSSSQIQILPNQANGHNANLSQDQILYNGQHNDIESRHIPSRRKTAKEEILKLSKQRVPYLHWFPTFSIKFGNTRIVVPNAKMVLVFFLLLICYFTRKKHATFWRFLVEKAVSLRNSLFDLWKLAFSYQVNPLAAVQALPTATSGNY